MPPVSARPGLQPRRGTLCACGCASSITARAVRFRYGLLVVDLITIGFVIASSFFFGSPVVEALDVVFGLLILADCGARLLISRPT